MNSTLIFQHELTVRPLAPVVSTHVDVAHHSVAYQDSATRSCTTSNPVATTNMGWLGGIGSKMNVSEVFASKRPTTRPLAEALT